MGVFQTKDEAEAAIQEALVNYRRGIDLLPVRLTVAEVVERFLSEGTGGMSPTTVHRYRELWLIHGSALGDYRVADLRKAHITRLYTKLQHEPRGTRKPLNPRTVLHLHRVLHRAFEWAVDQDLISYNIFSRVRPPRARDADTRALTMEEAAAFFKATKGTRFEAFFLLALTTGARRGELCGLKWDAVDLEGKTVTIRSALASTRAKKAERAAGAAGTVLKGTKSGRSRTVPLDGEAIAALRRTKAAQAAEELAAKPDTYENEGFVFTDKLGRPLKLDAPTKAFREAADSVSLPSGITLHSLRHSFASWSIANGGDIVGVQRVLGHSMPSTTLNLYSHAVAAQGERAVAATSDMLRQARAIGCNQTATKPDAKPLSVQLDLAELLTK